MLVLGIRFWLVIIAETVHQKTLSFNDQNRLRTIVMTHNFRADLDPDPFALPAGLATDRLARHRQQLRTSQAPEGR